MKRQPNILFCTHTSPTYMPAAELSTRQIVAGPNMPNKKSGMGRIMSMKTERVFDVAALIAQLPLDQKPDLLVVLLDAFRSSTPVNLKNVACRKILYIADTHHGRTPIFKLLDYTAQEQFDRYAMAHDPHHYHWFKEAGIKNLSIQLNLSARDYIKPVFPSSRIESIYFVGQFTALHLWRKKLIESLVSESLPIVLQAVPAHEAAKNYDKYQLCFNSSNGDLTMRFFEVLSAGGCLLTDRLSEASGYAKHFKDGEDLIIYDDKNDLIEKVRYYLARPELCLRIARNGHAKYKQYFSESKRKQDFLDFAFSSDDAAQAFVTASEKIDTRSSKFSAQSSAMLPTRIMVYEQMQELQRIDFIRSVVLSPLAANAFEDDLSDLMRIKLTRQVVDPELSCLVLTADEVQSLLSNSVIQKPRFIFVASNAPLEQSTLETISGQNYGEPQNIIFAHPGFFEHRVE